jgi:hypothetical protein
VRLLHNAEFFRFVPCLNRNETYVLVLVRKLRGARGGAPGDRANGRGENWNKTAAVCALWENGRGAARGEGRRPLAGAAKRLKGSKRQWAAIGKSWHGFGFGATPAWGWRRAGLGIDGTVPTVNAIGASGFAHAFERVTSVKCTMQKAPMPTAAANPTAYTVSAFRDSEPRGRPGQAVQPPDQSREAMTLARFWPEICCD